MNALGNTAFLATHRFPWTAVALTTSLMLLASGARALTFTPSCFTNHTSIGEVVADFNEDGKPDVAVSSAMDAPGGGLFLGFNLEVYLGNGDGTFGPPIVLNGPNTIGFTNFIAADVNNDGHVDLVAANGQGFVSVFEGHGDGTFSSVKNYGAGKSASGVASGDLNGDGRMDLVSGDGAGSSVAVLLGVGKGGGFKSRVLYPSAFRSRAIAVADLNGDGKPDVITANAAANGGPLGTTLSVLLGNGDGTLGPPSIVTLPKFTGRQLAVGDFDHDGHMDLAMGTQDAGSSGVLTLHGNGDGTFAPAVFYPTSTNGSNFSASLYLTTGDINGDGNLDLVVGDRRFDANFILQSADFAVLLGQGDGTFVNAGTTAVQFGNSPAIGDFNGDGRGDVAIDDCALLQTGPVVQSIRAGGDPTLATPTQLSLSFAPNPWHAAGRVSFTLPKSGPVLLAVYDIGGRRVQAIVDGDWFAAGEHSLALGRGAVLAPGVYLARLQTATGTAIQRIVVSAR